MADAELIAEELDPAGVADVDAELSLLVTLVEESETDDRGAVWTVVDEAVSEAVAEVWETLSDLSVGVAAAATASNCQH